MDWASTQALRHYLKGIEVPTAVLDQDALTTLRWMQGYALQYGSLPSEAHLAEHLGIRGWADELQAWPEVHAAMQERYVQRHAQPMLNEFMDAITKGTSHKEALGAMIVKAMDLQANLVSDHRMVALAGGLKERLAGYAEKLGTGYNPRVADTGFHQLDETINGIEIADLILLYAKFKQGKSTFKRQIIANLLRQGKRVVSITLENPADIEAMELEALFARVPIQPYLRYEMVGADFVDLKERLEVLNEPGMGECFIYDKLETRDIGSVAQLIHRHQADVWFLDQLTNLGREWKDIQANITACRQLAQNTRIPGVVLTQSDDTGKMKYARAMAEEAVKVLRLTDFPTTPTEMKAVVVEIGRRIAGKASIPLNFDISNGIIEEMDPIAPPPVDAPRVKATETPDWEQTLANMPWNQGNQGVDEQTPKGEGADC